MVRRLAAWIAPIAAADRPGDAQARHLTCSSPCDLCAGGRKPIACRSCSKDGSDRMQPYDPDRFAFRNRRIKWRSHNQTLGTRKMGENRRVLACRQSRNREPQRLRVEARVLKAVVWAIGALVLTSRRRLNGQFALQSLDRWSQK